MSEHAVYTGKQFGSYYLRHFLGEGGFAHVYLGGHIYFQTQAAIKVLKTTLSEDKMRKFRTGDESLHITRVLDFGFKGMFLFSLCSMLLFAPT